MLKKGLNYVKSPIREAAAQAHPESPPRPKTYSWTAAFVLRASFAVAKCVACVSTCVREETGNQLTLEIFCVRKEISCDQKQLRSRTASTWISPHAHKDMFLQNDCCDLAPPDRLMHTKMLRFRHGGTLGAIHAQEDMDLNHDQQTNPCDKNCCVLTPQAHLDLSPCAQRHVPAWMIGNSKARSSFYSSHARTRPLLSREPVARNLVAQRDMFL